MINSKKLVVFDLDGTISRSNLFSLPAIRDTQAALGFEVTDADTLLGFYGSPFEEFFPAILPGADESILPEYMAQLILSEQKYKHLARPFEGVPEMLDTLKAKGYKTAVCSNADRRYISFVLDTLALADKFDYIQELPEGMSSKSQSLKLLLETVQADIAVMVGDTSYDYLAAAENNIAFIGCVYGFRPKEMQEIKVKVQTPPEIVAAVEKIMGSFSSAQA